MPALALVRHAAAGEALGEARVVEERSRAQAVERGLDLVLSRVPALEQRTAQLRHAVVAAGQRAGAARW